MSPLASFVLAFALTGVLLALVVVTGLRAKRRLHIPLVVLALGALALTIVAAKRLGKDYDLSRAGVITPIHLTLAKVTTLAFLVPVATGIRTLFVPGGRRLHRRVVFVVLGMTVLTILTGILMLTGSEPAHPGRP